MQTGRHLIEMAQGAVEQGIVDRLAQALQAIAYQHQLAHLVHHGIQAIGVDADRGFHPGLGRDRRRHRRWLRLELSKVVARRRRPVESIQQRLEVIIANRIAAVLAENRVNVDISLIRRGAATHGAQ